MVCLLAGAGLASCAASGTTGANESGGDASLGGTRDTGAVAPDVAAGSDSGGQGAADASAQGDAPTADKTCQGLPDGTPCGAAPDACHDPPVCAGGQCGTPLAKASGTVCAAAPDACHTPGTCNGGTCGAPAARPDGYNWDSTDSTAICCGGGEKHSSSDSDCGACGIQCNASNGEACAPLGGHYFCRGCVASSLCWSKCCATDFTPYTCADSDCAGNCPATNLCPPGAHCVPGNGSSPDYCSY